MDDIINADCREIEGYDPVTLFMYILLCGLLFYRKLVFLVDKLYILCEPRRDFPTKHKCEIHATN